MIQQGPGAEEPSALHLPRSGADGGWYVKFGAIVGRAPVVDITWKGDAFEATAQVPGQDPMAISGTIEGGTLTLRLPSGPDSTAEMSRELVE